MKWRLQHILTHFYKCKPQPYSILQNILFKLIWILFSVLCLLFFIFSRKTNQNRTTDCSMLLWNLGANCKHILNTSWYLRNRDKSIPCWLWLKKKGVWLEAPFSLPWGPLSPTPPGKDLILLQEPKDLFHVQWSLTCHKVYHSCLSYILRPSKKL